MLRVVNFLKGLHPQRVTKYGAGERTCGRGGVGRGGGGGGGSEGGRGRGGGGGRKEERE